MRKGALAVASGVLTSSSAVAQRPLPTIAKIFAAAFPGGCFSERGNKMRASTKKSKPTTATRYYYVSGKLRWTCRCRYDLRGLKHESSKFY